MLGNDETENERTRAVAVESQSEIDIAGVTNPDIEIEKIDTVTQAQCLDRYIIFTLISESISLTDAFAPP